MTRARQSALRWFHERGAVLPPLSMHHGRPSERMIASMIRKKQIEITDDGWCLTDKGRCELHEATT